jgi:hypothetical protein
MTPPYPERLLPKATYHYIEGFGPLSDNYLQRWMPADWEVVYDDGDPVITGDTTLIVSGHIADFSTNLIGVFLPKDRAFQLTPMGIDKYGSLYIVDEDVPAPTKDIDYTHQPDLKQLFLRLGEITGKAAIYNKGEVTELKAICTPKHTPVKGNFWHVSLRWINADGDALNQKGSWRRRMLTAARTLIAEHAVLEISITETIPEDLYTAAD